MQTNIADQVLNALILSNLSCDCTWIHLHCIWQSIVFIWHTLATCTERLLGIILPTENCVLRCYLLVFIVQLFEIILDSCLENWRRMRPFSTTCISTLQITKLRVWNGP